LSDYNSLDFVVNGFFMKLFKTNNLETVTYCRTQFNFDQNTVLKERSDAFVRRYKLCNNIICTVVLNAI